MAEENEIVHLLDSEADEEDIGFVEALSVSSKQQGIAELLIILQTSQMWGSPT